MRRTFLVFLMAFVVVLCTNGMVVAGDSTWDQVKKNGVLRVGVTQSVPWFDKDLKTGEWKGFCHRAAEELANDFGVSLEEVEITWGSVVAALQSNKIDIMPCYDATPKRALAIDFTSSALLYVTMSVLAEENIKADTWEDLNREDISVSVAQGTSTDHFITRTLTKAKILRLPSSAETVAAFQSRRVNVTIMYAPQLVRFQKKLGRGKFVVPKPVYSSPGSIGLRPDKDKRFRDWMSAAVKYYHETHQVQQWWDEYLLSAGYDQENVPKIVKDLWYK